MSEIWEACRARIVPDLLSGLLLRMVESQEEIATRGVVDSLEEQAVLERLLERTKPARPVGTEKLHYLLATPFRYPPLRHGSRFGGRFEPSLFYGCLNRSALIAEASYYRFVFVAGMKTPISKPIATRHTAFSAAYASDRGIRLEAEPFQAFREALRSPVDYAATQALGAALRGDGIGACHFVSARDPDAGINVALFTPAALRDRAPRCQTTWQCETTPGTVKWRAQGEPTVTTVPITQFLVGGVLPTPAAEVDGSITREGPWPRKSC